MENDIDVEQLARSNNLREEKLRKFKQNIEAMQNNLRTKPAPAPADNFGYNSSLLRQLANDSQPLIDNASALSNFSVHNIQQLLNAPSRPPSHSPTPSLPSAPPTPTSMVQEDPFLASIESVLKKVKQTTTNAKFPTKAFEKYQDIKESMVSQENTSTLLKGTTSDQQPRKALHQYKQMLAEEERGHKVEEQSRLDSKRREKAGREKEGRQKEGREKEEREYGHRQLGSDLSGKSEWTETPRLPPTPNKTAVDRHKHLLRQEFQKLETVRQDYDHEVDFELSDD